MRGRRPGINDHGNRPAIEGIDIGNQHVKYERGSRVFLTASYGAVNKAVPVNPRNLDGGRLYEGRIGYVDGNGSLKRYDCDREGPLAIETLVAQVIPLLEEGQVLCVRDVAPKPVEVKGKGVTRARNERKLSRRGPN